MISCTINDILRNQCYLAKPMISCKSLISCTINDILQNQWYLAQSMISCKINDILQNQWYLAQSMIYCEINDILQKQWYLVKSMISCKINDILQNQWYLAKSKLAKAWIQNILEYFGRMHTTKQITILDTLQSQLQWRIPMNSMNRKTHMFGVKSEERENFGRCLSFEPSAI